MNHLRAALLIAVLMSQSASAQSEVLSVEELDQDGGKTVVAMGSGASIVDINSTLVFRINEDELKNEIASIGDLTSSTLRLQIQLVGELQKQVIEGRKLLPEYYEVYSKRQDGEDVGDDEAELNKKSGPVIVAILNAFPKDKFGARERLNVAFRKARESGGSWVDYYRAMIEQATIEVEEMKKDLNALAMKEGVYVQFGGWIATAKAQTPIHLNGFDNHPDASPYDVERWDFSLDEDEKSEIKRYTEIAEEYSSEERSLGDFISDQMKKSAESLEKGLKACLDTIIKTFDGLPETEENKAVVTSAKTLVTRLSFMINALTRGESQDLDKNLLITFNEASLDLSQDIKSLIDALNKAAIAAEATIKKSIEGIVSECTTQMNIVIKSNSSGIGAILSAALSSRSMIEMNQEFGDEVLKHDLGSIPSSSTLVLRNTGVRADGDFLSFRLAVGRQGKPLVTIQEFQIEIGRASCRERV